MPILNRRLLNSTALTNVSLISAGLMLASGPAMALGQNALPTNGQVIGGQATITQTAPNNLVINQTTNNAAINWQSFSIGSNATTTFNQPNSGSIAVNRVTGVDPSQIQGRLTANGQVVLVNPNGILFSKSAQVNVGGLVASTSGISEKNAIAGNLVFDQGSNPNAKIVNDGRISAKAGGLVALVSPSVVNNGIITAKLGKVSLASGDKWTLDLYGDQLVSFALSDAVVGEVKNTGVVAANGGSVQITANVAKDVVSNAIDMSGVVEANSISSKGGTIVLEANGGNVAVSGKLLANGQTGGTVEVTGETVALTGATISANGVNGGGKIDIGGEAHGGGTLAHATTVTVDSATKLSANAKKSGNGGTVSVWSDGDTSFAGSISAKGSTNGAGGTVETSGHNLTIDGAQVNVSGVSGQAGSWLLDPLNLTIGAAGATAIDTALNSGNVLIQTTANSASGSGTGINQSTTTPTTLGGYATVTTGTGDINVDSNIIYNSTNSLTFSAYDSINVNAVISNAGTGALVLRADNAASGSAVAGQVNISAGNYAISGGTTSIYYHPTNYATGSIDYVKAAGGATGGVVHGLTAYMLVDNLTDLNNVSKNLAGTYALGTNITVAGAFNPIGNATTPFSGIFDGNGGLGTNYNIVGPTLTTNAASTGGKSYVGVFGDNSGTIRNVDVVNAHVGGQQYLGALVGYNSGTLINDGATNVLVTSNASSGEVGGLVGYNSAKGTMINDYSTGNVSIGNASSFAGGLVGVNYGYISSGSFAGTVTVGCEDIGGLVGGNYGTVVDSTATGYVINSGGGLLGGFAGLNAGLLQNDSALNENVIVSAGNLQVGGFVGVNTSTGTVLNGFESGTLSAGSASTELGGFVGSNNGVISGATATAVLHTNNNSTAIGGFAGYNTGSISNATATSSVYATAGSTKIGGFVGDNAGTIMADNALNTYVTVASATTSVGGFAGLNEAKGLINVDGSTGTVTAAAGAYNLGGLVGANYGNIQTSGGGISVLASNNATNVGALVGGNYGTVNDSESFGPVSVGAGSSNIAGLVGYNTGSISDSRAGGNVQAGLASGASAVSSVGGVVGTNATGGTVTTSRFFGYVTAGPAAVGVGGLVGNNQKGATVINDEVNGYVSAGNGVIGASDYVGINEGTVTTGTVSGSLFAGNNAYYVGGAVGLNDAGAKVSGVTVNSYIAAGNNATAVGGIVGLNGSDATSANTGYKGNFGTSTASVSNSSFGGTVTVGTNSFAVGGLAGWDSTWKSTGGASVTGSLSSLTGTGLVTSAANGGTTFIHNANQVGCEEAAGGNCFGIAGKETITVNPNDLTTTYGQTAPALTYGLTYTVPGQTGTVNGLESGDLQSDVLQVTLKNNSNGAGTTAITGSANVNPANANGLLDYNVVFSTKGTVTVNKAVVTVTANGSQTYGGTNVNVSYSYNGLVNGDTAGAISGVSYSTPATAKSNVGTYSITAVGGTAANYTIVDATGTYVVNKAVVTATANGSQTYGGANAGVSYSYTGLVNGDATGVVTGLGYTTPVTAKSNAGTYTITATGGTASNYTVVDGTGTYVVNKAGLTVTANGSQTYGGTNKTVSYSYTGLVNGDATGVVTGVSYTTPVTAQSNAGTYGITATGGTASNYTITDGTGVYTVNKAGVTVVANGSQTYGGSNQTVSYTYTGLVNGDATGVITGVSYTTPVTAKSNAGTYTITATGGTGSNYTVTDGTGVYTVNKANVTVGVTGTQVYGSPSPTVSYSYTGLVNGDTPGVITGVSYTTPVTQGSNVGTYTITATGGAGGNNYNVTDAPPGALNVTPAPLTVIANDTTRPQGSNSPAFTASFSGLVNGDAASVVTGLAFAPGDTSGLNAGIYTNLITVGGGSAQNYTLTYVAGTLTVSAAPVTPVTPPTTTGTPTIPGQVETVQGQIAGLNSLLVTFNQAANNNQVNCLKVNSEVRGVTTDSPIDCAAPLQVNGF